MCRNDPDLPVRLAGASAAPGAGARAGVGVAPPRRLRPGADKGRAPGWPRTYGAGRPKSQRSGCPGPGAGRHRPGRPGSGAVPRFGHERRRLGNRDGRPGLGSGSRPRCQGGQREPFGHSRQPRAVRRGVHHSFPKPPNPLPTEEFSWLTKDEPESRPRAATVTLGGRSRPATAGPPKTADGGYGWQGRAETARPRRH